MRRHQQRNSGLDRRAKWRQFHCVQPLAIYVHGVQVQMRVPRRIAVPRHVLADSEDLATKAGCSL